MNNLNLFHFKLVIFLLILNCPQFLSTFVRFTNIKCEEFDKPFADFKHCQIKVIGRNKVALRVHVRLFQIPVNNVSVRFFIDLN